MKTPSLQINHDSLSKVQGILHQALFLQKLQETQSQLNSATRATESNYEMPPRQTAVPVQSQFSQRSLMTTNQPDAPTPNWNLLSKMCESDSDSSRKVDYHNSFEQETMMQHRQRGFKRGSYARIPDETRARLIKMVVEDGVGVVKATAALNIKYTTGKHIVRRYLRTGQFADKRFKHITHPSSANRVTQVDVEQPQKQLQTESTSLAQQKSFIVNLLENAQNSSVVPQTSQQLNHQPPVKSLAEWMAKINAPKVQPTIEMTSSIQPTGELINSVQQPVANQSQPSDHLTSSAPQLVGQQGRICTINVNGKQLRFLQLNN